MSDNRAQMSFGRMPEQTPEPPAAVLTEEEERQLREARKIAWQVLKEEFPHLWDTPLSSRTSVAKGELITALTSACERAFEMGKTLGGDSDAPGESTEV